MPSKEFDRTLTGMVSTGLEKVKRIASVGVYTRCGDCGNLKPMFGGGACPHTHMMGDEDTKVTMTFVAPATQPEREVLSAPIKTVPKDQFKSRDERIDEVMKEVAPFSDRKDGGYRRTTAARAETQLADPFTEKVDRFCSSIAYENPDSGLVDDDEDYIDPLPKYFLERRD